MLTAFNGGVKGWIGLACALGLAGMLTAGELRTFTNTTGRTIRAELVSSQDGSVVIKREDGLTFTLRAEDLSAEDQAWIKEASAKDDATTTPAAKPPAGLPKGSVEVQISRGKFDSKKKDDEGVVLIEEEWGYSVTIFNRTVKPLKDLRVEYILFVKPDAEPGKDAVAATLKRKKGKLNVPEIEGRQSLVVRTDSVTMYKQQLKAGYIWKKTGTNAGMRDSLYGVWLKIMAEGQVVAEICNPESLAKTQPWAD